ncbi:MAG: argininosuccinate synthase [Oligoflexia bacterium]|nr:argininosuccinate synthase [Oligoflexia bacterium]
MSNKKRVVVAFSGGLDTSFCVIWLKSQGYEVATITVDTGGFAPEELARIEKLSADLGTIKHCSIDGRQQVYDSFGAYIIKGNILRGGVYPLCVGSERMVQAAELVKYATALKADAVCHGSTGAGNDQVRFDVQIRCLNPKLEIIAPIRSLAISREDEVKFLKEHGFDFPSERKTYSINQGILGTTIGGGVLHDSWQSAPEEAYILTKGAQSVTRSTENIVIGFEAGLPTVLNGTKLDGCEILAQLNTLGGEFGIGRGVHVGDTTLGIKGRLAFEAPGATILIQAHRELEKLILTKLQLQTKEQLAQSYGALLHEGQWSNPVMRDFEAFIDSTQRLVSGEVRVKLAAAMCVVEGVRSPNSLMHAGAVYGEGSRLWSGVEAAGFCKIFGMQSILAGSREN